MSSRDLTEVVRPIRIKTTVTAEGESTTPLVHCPQQNEYISAQTCAGCMRMRSLEWQAERGGEVHCLLSNQPREPDRRADFAELAARTMVMDVAGSVVTCVTRDVSLLRVREIFTRTSQRAIAVVDEEGRLAGIVSRSDLVNAPETGTVADVMTPRVHALPEDSPLPYAVSLLAHDDLSEVPVVAADGTVTGICHALDLVRWLAARLGYTRR